MEIDHLNGELLMAIEWTGKDVFCNTINKAYKTGEVPTNFEKCVMIPIPKMKKAVKCEEHRTIS